MNSFTHNGYRVTIEHDQDATNPLDDGHDFNMYMIWDGRNMTGDYHTPVFTEEQIKGNEQAIAETLGYDSYEEMYDRFEGADTWDSDELVNFAIDHFLDWSLNSQSDKIGLFSTLLELQGCKTIIRNCTGYVQSQWHIIMLSLDADLAKLFDDPEKAMADWSELYTAWCYGDSYGYVIEKPVKCNCCNHVTWKQIDSCWGFTGKTDSKNYEYMIDQAKEACPE